MKNPVIGGNTYNIGSLSPLIQFHIVRRLLPVLASVMPLVLSKKLQGAQSDEDLLTVLIPVTEAFANLSDEDANYVIHKALSVVTRKEPNDLGWSPVLNPANGFQYPLTMIEMAELVYRVLEENIGDFSSALQRFTPQG